LKENTSGIVRDVFPDRLPSAKLRIRDAIVRHVRQYPDVADTARGIVAWWLPQRGYENAPDNIACVLEEMVAANLLQVMKMPDGQMLYRRGPAIDV